MTYLRTGLTLTATLALTVSHLPPAFAQGGGGPTGVLSISQGLEFSDNFDLDSSTSGTTITSRTGLGFGFQSQTRAEALQFSIRTEAVGEYGGGAADTIEIENTEARLDFTRQGSDSALSFSASYQEIDLDQSSFTSGPSFGIGIGSQTIVIDDGVAAVTSLSGSFAFGTNSPFGLRLSAGYYEEDYTNTLDPALIDREIVSADALAQFRISPASTVRALAGVSRETEVGLPFDIDDSYVGIGFGGQTGGGLSFTTDLIYDRTEFGPITDDGLGIDASVVQDRPSGNIGVAFRSRLDNSGRRTEALVNRSMPLPTGSLDFSIGVVDQEGDTSLRPKGSLTFQRDTPGGSLTASITQDPSVDTGVFYGNTSLAVGYTQSIDSTSAWAADFDFTAVNNLNSPLDDERASARFTYSRALTPEWQMNTGLEHRRESINNGPTESSNTLFINVRRDISFGF